MGRAVRFQFLAALLIQGCLVLCARAQNAQFQVLASLGTPPLNPSTPLIQATDGKLYGTTPNGGANNSGAIFRIDSAGTLETLYSFTLPYHPEAGLIQAADGQFYGTAVTVQNGSSQYFKMNTTGNLTVLHTSTVAEGSYPSGTLLQATDGNFYGTTRYGGAHGIGIIFTMDSTGALAVLHNFDAADGANPDSGLIQTTDGNFYGTTLNGGAGNVGTVFRFDYFGNLTILHSFNGADGAHPSAGLVRDIDGYLYGTTQDGGAADLGTIFRIDAQGNLTTLHSFEGTDGEIPLGALLDGGEGEFYGTNSAGGANGYGTIFKMNRLGALTTVYDFSWADGIGPAAGLTLASDGRLYGTAQLGGLASGGTLFSTDAAGNFSVLYRFHGSDGTEGQTLYAGLLPATDGYLYGAAFAGGATGHGTIFRMNPSGQLATVHSFTGNDGANPTASLIQAIDGSLYGTTQTGGIGDCFGGLGCGTVFRLDLAANLTVLHLFQGAQYGDGASPYASLFQAADHLFYGTTQAGGQINLGTIYRLDALGNTTLLHSFGADFDGVAPKGALIQDSYGSFYGTTWEGGTGLAFCGGGCGIVFKMDSAGTVTTIHNFTGNPLVGDGAFPQAGLIVSPEPGFFYGTAEYGGALGFGTIFKIGANGNLTTIHDFQFQDGALPVAAPLMLSNGDVYGTTSRGEDVNGEVFKVDSGGTFSIIYQFTGSDGSRPEAALVRGLDGWVYGTTLGGGSYGQGALFRFSAPGLMRADAMSPSCGPDGTGTVASITGSFPNPAVTVTLGGQNANVISPLPAQIEIAVPSGTPGEVADLTVTDPQDGSSVKLFRVFVYDFLDVPSANPFHDFICKIVRNGLSAGCGAGNFCPTDPVLRSQMAVFLLQGEHGSVYLAPSADCATYPFADVPCPSVFANYILQLYDEGITGGCASNPLRFCPSDPVSRADMAVFLLSAEHGTGYVPPACSGVFADVACPGAFTNWIEALYAEGITAGCGANPLNYCPESPVTRAQMAVFLSSTFNLS